MAESSISKGFGIATGGCLFIVALVIGIPVIGIIALVVLGVLGSMVTPSNVPKISEDTKVIYDAPTDSQALEAAQRFVVGTWSYTASNHFWQKWVIQNDGTVYAYTANQADGGWGEPKVFDWKVVKATYSDTGEIYYAFHATGRTLSDGALDAAIEKDGSLSAISRYDSSVYAILHRGDDEHFNGN